MKKTTNRIISTMLCIALLFSAVALTVDAESEEANKIAVLPKRFCTDEITVENAVAEKNNNGSVSLTFNGSSPNISMKVIPLKAETNANALRIVLKNESTVNGMRLDYTYKDENGNSKTGSSYVDVNTSSENVEYVIPVFGADSMTNLAVNFNGDENASGIITIVSIGAISYCVDDKEYVGTLESSKYDSASGTAIFSGSVLYDTILSNPNSQVVLYMLASNESIDDVDFTHPCVASCPITLSFRFDFKVNDVSDICARYFAAVRTENNQILPITPETYLIEISSGEAADFESDVGFKGIETNLYAGAVENGTSLAVVDVYLNRLKNSHGDGYQYILGDGQEYYFDRNYIAELDAAIKSYDTARTDIYLRFLVDCYDASFSTVVWNDQIKNVDYYAVDSRNSDVAKNLYACTDFIVSRYTSEEFASLRGIVWGRALDKAYQYNYCGMMPMAEYADVVARSFGVLKQVVDKTGKALEIILPMSNNVLGAELLINADIRDKSYPANMLSECVVKLIRQYGFDLSSLYFMLESTNAPILSQRFEGATDYMTFINAVDSLAHKYDGLNSEILFCWYPDKGMASNDITASYIYNYNFLACTKEVRSYIISIVDNSSDDMTFEKNVFTSLKNTYKYIDTQNNLKIGENVLAILGMESWEEAIAGYSEEKAVQKTLAEESLLYSFPSEVIGSYTMWDFSKLSGTAGWGMADGCSSLMIYSPLKDTRRALVAGFDSNSWGEFGAEYGSIIYHSSDLITDGISGISFDLIIPSRADNEQEIFELKITFGSGDVTLETSGVIKKNVKTTVYADISSIDKMEYAKISIRPLDGDITSGYELLVNSVAIHSEKYNDNELENIVLSGEIIGDGGESAASGEEDVVVFVLMIIGIVSILTIWGAFWTIQRNQRR